MKRSLTLFNLVIPIKPCEKTILSHNFSFLGLHYEEQNHHYIIAIESTINLASLTTINFIIIIIIMIT